MNRISEPKVSVLMTVYNREEYIAVAIESVLAQSYRNFELLIVDDRSTDRSVEIARSYETDSRVSVFINEKNLGDYPNRNKAASYATGDYIKYLDADDAMYPHALEVMVDLMEAYPESGILLYTTEESPFYPFELSPVETYRRLFVHLIDMSNSPTTTMYRRSSFESLGGFDTQTWNYSCDLDLLLRMSRTYPTVFISMALFFYRLHADQVSNKRGNLLNHRIPNSSLICLSALRHDLCPLPVEERNIAIGRYLKLGLFYAAGLALKKYRPDLMLRLIFNLKPDPAALCSCFLMETARTSEPNYSSISDFSKLSRYADNSKSDDLANVTVIIYGGDSTHKWEQTIKCCLEQTVKGVQVILLNPPEDLSSVNTDHMPETIRIEGDHWGNLNKCALKASGKFIKFVQAGDSFLPHMLEFEIYPLEKDANVNYSAYGELGAVPYLMKLNFEQSLACDFESGWQVFRVPLNRAILRTSAFVYSGGFIGKWDEWAPYELFVRISINGGAVHGFLSLIGNDFGSYPKEEISVPDELLERINELLKKEGVNSLNIHSLKGKGKKLLQEAVNNHLWDWKDYPWAAA